MSNILITGATENTGMEVIRFLFENDTPNRIIAGVRDVDKAKRLFSDFPKLEYVRFDFEDATTFDEALSNTDRVFLLRPPHISDEEKYFKPLIESFLNHGVTEVVFLSVQGAEKSKVIPHNKIELLIIIQLYFFETYKAYEDHIRISDWTLKQIGLECSSMVV